MSLRLEMLQVARLAPRVLGDSTRLVRDFFGGQQNPDGGFKNRNGQSDLYYSVFGLEGLLATAPTPPHREPAMAAPAADLSLPKEVSHRALGFLRQLDSGENLDFVHLCCLARAWSTLGVSCLAEPAGIPPALRERLLGRLETFRASDGGYNQKRGSTDGTVYDCFLALGAWQDLQAELPESSRLVECILGLQTDQGCWANAPKGVMDQGSTNATAAGVACLRNLSAPISPKAGEWLMAQSHPQGGFLAAPKAPMPDLLSTASALHALAGLEVPLESVRERCLDFIDSLWTNHGGFHGYWLDDALDCEYTFYGLLALGHLSL